MIRSIFINSQNKKRLGDFNYRFCQFGISTFEPTTIVKYFYGYTFVINCRNHIKAHYDFNQIQSFYLDQHEISALCGIICLLRGISWGSTTRWGQAVGMCGKETESGEFVQVLFLIPIDTFFIRVLSPETQ